MIETTRLKLVPCGAENLTEIHALWTNDEVKYFLFDNRTISLDESRSFVEASEENFQKHGWGIWLVRLRESGEAVGFAGFLAGDNAAPRLLYGLHPDYWRRGLAYEAAQAVFDYAVNDLKIQTIFSDVDEPNAASVKILEKLGMKQTHSAKINESVFLYYEWTKQGEANP